MGQDRSDTMSVMSRYNPDDDDDDGPRKREIASDAMPTRLERTAMSMKKRKVGQIRLTCVYTSASKSFDVTVHNVEGLSEKVRK